MTKTLNEYRTLESDWFHALDSASDEIKTLKETDENQIIEELENKLEKSQKDNSELKEEIGKVKEVLEFLEEGHNMKDESLDMKDKTIEVKKDLIRKLKLEIIKLKENKLVVKKRDVLKADDAFRRKVKEREAKEKITKEKVGTNEFPCTKCEKKETSKSDLMIHMDLVHKDNQQRVDNEVKPNPDVCRNGETCSWFRNNRCKFQHISRPEMKNHKRSNHSSKENDPRPCRNGPGCNSKKDGGCKFSHHQNPNHGKWQEPRRPAGFRRHQGRDHREEEERVYNNVEFPELPVAWCIDGDNCSKGRRCMQKHTSWQHENLRSFWETSRNTRN